jgi:transposase
MSSEHEKKGGRRPSLQAEHVEILRVLVQEKPLCTLEELGAEFAKRAGFTVSAPTLRKGLQAAGVQRRRPVRGGRREAAEERPPPSRYGYTEAHRDAGEMDRYASGLTEAEWALAQDLFEAQDARGRPPRYARRHMVNACCYVLRTGCAWRHLPKDFPPWPAVHKAFSRWAAQGVFERFHDRLREQWRQRQGKTGAPTAAILDSQSTRISPQGGESGYDAGKKVKGRKRHLVVDSLGLLLAVMVSAASVQDRDGALPTVALACQKYPSLEKLYVDTAYAGGCAQVLRVTHALDVEVVRHPGNRNVGRWRTDQDDLFDPAPPQGFMVLPKRWVVERTHAWVERSRRLVMHHDRATYIATNWVWLAEARMLARRLTSQSG